MDEPSAGTAPTIDDAVEALIALGWPVIRTDENIEPWQIGVAVFSDAELLEFAVWAGIFRLPIGGDGLC